MSSTFIAMQSLPASTRLLALDAFRGLVILSMLIVNNIGDYSSTGYFWKHADWVERSQAQAYRAWWSGDRRITQFPLLKHCTLADFVMPNFMLIIGVAIPFSAAKARASYSLSLREREGMRARAKEGARSWRVVLPAGPHPNPLPKGEGTRPHSRIWLRVLKRAFLLVLLGWILCYFRDQFAPQLYGERPFHISLGMDVLQLLGISYLVARILYELPIRARVILIITFFIWHWAVLRFWTQGPDVPRGTFTAEHNAISYIYTQPWWIWRSFEIGPWISMSWNGLMSVPPAAATMLLGTIIGDWIRRSDVTRQIRASRLALCGLMLATAGFLWAFDLPFNKPRWSPAYLVYASAVGSIVLAMLYVVIDIRGHRKWCYPLVVFGVNAIAAYFITILTKVLLLNTLRVNYGGTSTSLLNALLLTLKGPLGPWLGGWVFTIAFVTFWWLIFHLAYRRRIFWKL